VTKSFEKYLNGTVLGRDLNYHKEDHFFKSKRNIANINLEFESILMLNK